MMKWCSGTIACLVFLCFENASGGVSLGKSKLPNTGVKTIPTETLSTQRKLPLKIMESQNLPIGSQKLPRETGKEIKTSLLANTAQIFSGPKELTRDDIETALKFFKSIVEKVNGTKSSIEEKLNDENITSLLSSAPKFPLHGPGWGRK